MQTLNFLKPNRVNIKNYSLIGSFLVLVSLIDVISNAFLKVNLTSFLPGSLTTLFPLIIGLIGLNMMRIDYSGNKKLDLLNKNINTNNFNALLTLVILFSIIKALPQSLSWMIFDATISGDSKDACTGTGACWTYIKVWFRRFMYGMYPNEFHWRINTAFILVIALGFVGYFMKENLKKYLALYYVIIYPVIAYLVIYYLISGGSFGLQWVETGAWGGLSLTFIVSFFCLIFCFPLGMIFALGRRSNLPVIKYI